MNAPRIEWYLCSRGEEREHDYTWVAGPGAAPPTEALRDSLEEATREWITGGVSANVFLREDPASGTVQLALWQLRNDGWPSDAENRPIMVHVMGFGPRTDQTRAALRAAAARALTGAPPEGLRGANGGELGFRVDFAELDRWAAPDAAVAESLDGLVRERGGGVAEGGFNVCVPKVVVRPKAPKRGMGALAVALAVALMCSAALLLALVL